MPTPPTTSNHNLPLIPPIGDTNAGDYEDIWGGILNDDAWSSLDTKLIARDTIANQGNYTAYQDALFRATDTGELYYGDGTSWILADGEFDALTSSTLTVSTAPSSSTDVARKSEIDTLDTNKLETSNYNPETDTHNRYADSEAIAAADGEISLAATSLSGLDSAVDSNDTDISNLQSDKFDAVNYTPETDTHSKYTDSEAVSAIEATSGITLTAGLDLSGDITDSGSVIWDSSAGSVLSTALEADSVSVAGRSVSLGGSTNISHGDLTSVSEDQHHTKNHDHSEADITAIPNVGLANSSVTVAGNAISLGGNSSIAHADLSTIGSDDHHAQDHDHSGQGVSTVGNQGLTNYQVTVAGNTVALGASTGVDHADLTGLGTDNHHIAHEHPGDQAASSNLDMSSNSIDNVANITGQYATHGFGGSSYNIDLTDSTADARYRSTNTDTIIWFKEGGNVAVPNGQLSEQGNRVATRSWSSSTFENFGTFTWSEETGGDLVLTDGNVELIRQPKGKPTQFVQGADIGPIETPEDSYVQIINTPVTSNAVSGDRIGQSLSVDNQTFLSLEADADGSGGTTGAISRFPNSDVEVGGNGTGDVRISGELTENSSL